MHMAGAAGEDLLRLLRAGPGPRLPIYHRSLHGEFRRITGSGVNATKTTRLLSRPGEFHPEPLTGRVEDWRAGLGRSLYYWDRSRARPAVGEGFPFLLFRLQDGFTVPPWLTFPEAPLSSRTARFPGSGWKPWLSSAGLPKFG